MPPLALISSIASIVAFFIEVSAIDRSPESENRTPTLIASLEPPPAAAVLVVAVLDVPVAPHAARRLPTAVVPTAAAPARLRTSRRVGCRLVIDLLFVGFGGC